MAEEFSKKAFIDIYMELLGESVIKENDDNVISYVYKLALLARLEDLSKRDSE